MLKPTRAIYRIRLPQKVWVFFDIYPMKYMGKAIDTCGRLKFQPPQTKVLNQNLCCGKSKQDRVIDASFGCYGNF